MEYLIIIVFCIISILILKVGMNIKIKDIKKVKKLGTDEKLTSITNKFSENKEICEDILEMLNNKNVSIEEAKDEKSQTSLYLIMSNKILIANIKENFTRIQTIVHECIHSIQNKTLLKFNFICSNINILYFIIICILLIFKINNKEIVNIFLLVLFLFEFIIFVVRSFLEVDAMVRAEFISIEYIHKKRLLEKEEVNLIKEKYKELNKIGIKLYVFFLSCRMMIKPIIYCIIASLKMI